MICFGRVRFEFECRNNFRQEDPIAEFPADEVRMLADETKAGPLRQIAFEEWSGIHIPKGLRVLASESIDEFGKEFEAFADDVVVIVESGVTGDGALTRDA